MFIIFIHGIKNTNNKVVDNGAVSADEASGRWPSAIPSGQYAPGRRDGPTGTHTHIFIITNVLNTAMYHLCLSMNASRFLFFKLFFICIPYVNNF